MQRADGSRVACRARNSCFSAERALADFGLGGAAEMWWWKEVAIRWARIWIEGGGPVGVSKVERVVQIA